MIELINQIFTGALLGLYIGVVPVFLGFFFLPVLQRLSNQWKTFIVCISLGVLLFLFIDVTAESIELSNKLIAGLLIPADGQATVPEFDKFLFSFFGPHISELLGHFILIIGVLIGVVGLIAADLWIRRMQTNSNTVSEENDNLYEETNKRKNLQGNLTVAILISIGIGLHNLGEGLVVGVAMGTGNISLALFLIYGFAIHNISEGIAITGPISDAKTNISVLVFLGFIAGLPTILGSIIGLLVFANSIGLFFFAIASGSLLYVVVNILVSISSDFKKKNVNYIAILIGFFVMYLTSLLVII